MPTPSTIWRILTARGFIDPQPQKAPKTTGRRFVAERANECWQLDDTTWVLADETAVKVIDIVDDDSRLLVASAAMDTCTGAETLAVMADAAAVLGRPERLLSTTPERSERARGRGRQPRGEPRRSRPCHPRPTAKSNASTRPSNDGSPANPERATSTSSKRRSTSSATATTTTGRIVSIDRRTPADVWTTPPKSGPARRSPTPPPRPAQVAVNNGRIRHRPPTARSRSAAGHNGQATLAVVTGSTGHVFIDGRQIRELTIDPTRKYQPTTTTDPGRPPSTVSDDPRHP